MDGKLGGLFRGRIQIGGLRDWSLDLTLADYPHDNTTIYKLAKWKLTAQSYWLFDIPDKVLVRLYPDYGKGYWEGKGVIASQTRKLFDTLIPEPIELIGEGVLESKDG
jgi:hypothetical protein